MGIIFVARLIQSLDDEIERSRGVVRELLDEFEETPATFDELDQILGTCSCVEIREAVLERMAEISGRTAEEEKRFWELIADFSRSLGKKEKKAERPTSRTFFISGRFAILSP